MQITNKYRVPQAFVNAVKHYDAIYSKGDADFSVTELLSPPHEQNLKKIHFDDITEDASERVWSLFGNLTHTLLEKSCEPDDIVEKRFFRSFRVNGTDYRVSGQVDLLEPLDPGYRLSDWKTTSVWNVVNGDYSEWEAQLNILRYLVSCEHPKEMKEIQIVVIMRDWRTGESLRNPDYPPHPIKKIEFPIWTLKQVEDFVADKISYRVQFPEDDVCTPDERWQTPTQFAVMSKGRKSAHRLCETIDEAEVWMEENKKGDRIEKRISEPKRCLNYCSVAQFCSYGRHFILKEGWF